MRPACNNENHNDGGFALLLALWAVLLLSALGASLMMETQTTRAVASSQSARTKAKLIAEGAINRSIMALLDPNDPVRLRLDGTPSTMSLLGQQVTVSCESETGKIDLNFAPAEFLTTILKTHGLSDEEATAISLEIIDWRSRSLAPRARDETLARYRNTGLQYEPRFDYFRSVGELRLVRGMEEPLYLKLAPVMTIWSGSGIIDRSVASSLLLQTLQAAKDNLAVIQLDAKKSEQAAGADRLPAVGEALTITAKVYSAGVMVTQSAVIQIAGDRREPYRVLAWR